jgi:hypothetical protein
MVLSRRALERETLSNKAWPIVAQADLIDVPMFILQKLEHLIPT